MENKKPRLLKKGDKVQFLSLEEWNKLPEINPGIYIMKRWAGRMVTIKDSKERLWRGYTLYIIEEDNLKLDWIYLDFVQVENVNEKVFSILRGNQL